MGMKRSVLLVLSLFAFLMLGNLSVFAEEDIEKEKKEKKNEH